jgi:hypothetical protein
MMSAWSHVSIRYTTRAITTSVLLSVFAEHHVVFCVDRRRVKLIFGSDELSDPTNLLLAFAITFPSAIEFEL